MCDDMTDEDILHSINSTLNGFIDGVDNAHPLVQYLLLVCALDASANYWCGRKSVGCASAIFKTFVELYLPEEYRKMAKVIFSDLRCSLVHNFALGNQIVLTAGNPNLQLLDSNGDSIQIVNLENFKGAVRQAVGALIDDARNAASAPRFEDPKSPLESYVYTFKGKKALAPFLTKEEFDTIRRIESKGLTSTSVGQNDREWVFNYRARYRELKDKYEFVSAVIEEMSPSHTLMDNMRSAIGIMGRLQTKTIGDTIDGDKMSHISNPGVFTITNALTATTDLDLSKLQINE